MTDDSKPPAPVVPITPPVYPPCDVCGAESIGHDEDIHGAPFRYCEAHQDEVLDRAAAAREQHRAPVIKLPRATRPERITVIVMRVGRAPVVETIGTTLEDAQGLVRGDIEDIYLSSDEHGALYLRCNENGKNEGLLPNLMIPGSGDLVVGDVYITRVDAAGVECSVVDADVRRFVYNDPPHGLTRWPLEVHR